jgi:hypothetical protein
MIHVNVSLSAGSDVPTIGNFVSGSQTSLGLKTENDSNTWYLIVTNAQDYENPTQRFYRFSVTAGGVGYDVVLSIRNLDDGSPYFLLPDSTSCAINVSNALNKPHSLHLITD